ncbi:MAG: hypothetical protein RLZZ136_1461 [Pseudomonadota bacterium]
MLIPLSPAEQRASFWRWTLVFVPLIVLLGLVSAQLGNPDSAWFRSLVKPAIYPPPATFGIVWTLLYIFMGMAVALIATPRKARGRGIALSAFVLQMALNLAWTPLFFGLHQITLALYLLFALDVAVLGTLVLFWRVRRRAGLLLLPYLLWVVFATQLNAQFLAANPDADGQLSTNGVVRITLGS